MVGGCDLTDVVQHGGNFDGIDLLFTQADRQRQPSRPLTGGDRVIARRRVTSRKHG